MQALKELISIDKNFQTAVNLRLDRQNADKVKGYIPTTSSVALLHQFLQNISDRQGKRASVLIGPYGKGKSHLLLVLLALLEQSFPQEQQEILEKVAGIDSECSGLAGRIAEKGPFLTVLVSEGGNSLNTAFLLALQEALSRRQLSELMPDSYYSEAIKCIQRWKKEYPDTYARFEILLRESKAGHAAAQVLTAKLEKFDEEALQTFKQIYPKLTAGTEFAPLINMEAVVLYREVNQQLCTKYGYQGIYVVFDEFSKYLEGHAETGFAADMKVLQDMCELANAAQEENFFLNIVTHKSLKEYTGKFSKQMQNQFRGVEGRLQEYLFVASARNNYDLIGNVFSKTEIFEKEYSRIEKQSGWLLEKSYELPNFGTQFSWEEYVRVVARGCFPLTPLAAVLLLAISEKIAQNERTLFTFLSGDEQNSVYRLVYGKKKQEGYIGADAVYDYFAPIMREAVDYPEVHNEWLKAEYAMGQEANPIQSRIIKTMAVLQIAGNRQEMPVNVSNISLAAGIPMEIIEENVKALVERNLLIWRSRMGCYAFCNNIGVNLDEEMQEVMKKYPAKLDLSKELDSISELDYILPKSYNQRFSITRYFQYVFMSPEVMEQTADTAYFFQEHFSDGKLIAWLSTEEADLQEAVANSKRWKDSRVLILVPDRPFSQEENVRKIMAVRELLANPDFMEDNKVLEQELKLYMEDLLFEINASLEMDFLPQNHCCKVVWNGECRKFAGDREFNTFLSDICGEYYNFSPKVNHELLNIQNVTGQYLKARNHVVEDILLEKPMEAYEQGTSPESMVYRTALVRTGLVNDKFALDVGTAHILEEIKGFLLESTQAKQCFGKLYSRLQGRSYGVRKGLLPLFFAVEFVKNAGTPVLYLQSKEVNCNAEILNNINDRPEQYYLYLEQVDGQKEVYLTELENYFGVLDKSIQKQIRNSALVERMQRKYRALPKVVLNWKEFDEEAWKIKISQKEGVSQDAEGLYQASEKLLTYLRRVDVNARELLFERIPAWLQMTEADLNCAYAVEVMFEVWQGKCRDLQRKLAENCRTMWGAGESESLAAYLQNWYRKRAEAIQNRVLGTKAKSFCSCIEAINHYDDEEIAADLAYAISDVHLEDWTKETGESFYEDLRHVKSEIEDSAEQENEVNAKKIAFTNEEGKLVERYFQPEAGAVGDFLKNAIREALDEFGDSMETGQKVAVLVEALEELLK